MTTRPIHRTRFGIEDIAGKTIVWQNGSQHLATAAEIFYRDGAAPGYMVRTTDGQIISSGVCRVVEEPEHNPMLSDCGCESCKRQAERRVRAMNAKPRKGSY